MAEFLEHRQKLKKITEFDQCNVDNIIHPVQDGVSEVVRIPKSIDPLTLEKVLDEIGELGGAGVNAEDMGLRVGIGRTTARRYLEFLVSQGAVKPSLVYGSVGRPERLYFYIAP